MNPFHEEVPSRDLYVTFDYYGGTYTGRVIRASRRGRSAIVEFYVHTPHPKFGTVRRRRVYADNHRVRWSGLGAGFCVSDLTRAVTAFENFRAMLDSDQRTSGPNWKRSSGYTPTLAGGFWEQVLANEYDARKPHGKKAFRRQDCESYYPRKARAS